MSARTFGIVNGTFLLKDLDKLSVHGQERILSAAADPDRREVIHLPDKLEKIEAQFRRALPAAQKVFKGDVRKVLGSCRSPFL